MNIKLYIEKLDEIKKQQNNTNLDMKKYKTDIDQRKKDESMQKECRLNIVFKMPLEVELIEFKISDCDNESKIVERINHMGSYCVNSLDFYINIISNNKNSLFKEKYIPGIISYDNIMSKLNVLKCELITKIEILENRLENLLKNKKTQTKIDSSINIDKINNNDEKKYSEKNNKIEKQNNTNPNMKEFRTEINQKKKDDSMQKECKLSIMFKMPMEVELIEFKISDCDNESKITEKINCIKSYCVNSLDFYINIISNNPNSIFKEKGIPGIISYDDIMSKLSVLKYELIAKLSILEDRLENLLKNKKSQIKTSSNIDINKIDNDDKEINKEKKKKKSKTDYNYNSVDINLVSFEERNRIIDKRNKQERLNQNKTKHNVVRENLDQRNKINSDFKKIDPIKIEFNKFNFVDSNDKDTIIKTLNLMELHYKNNIEPFIPKISNNTNSSFITEDSMITQSYTLIKELFTDFIICFKLKQTNLECKLNNILELEKEQDKLNAEIELNKKIELEINDKKKKEIDDIRIENENLEKAEKLKFIEKVNLINNVQLNITNSEKIYSCQDYNNINMNNYINKISEPGEPVCQDIISFISDTIIIINILKYFMIPVMKEFVVINFDRGKVPGNLKTTSDIKNLSNIALSNIINFNNITLSINQ